MLKRIQIDAKNKREIEFMFSLTFSQSFFYIFFIDRKFFQVIESLSKRDFEFFHWSVSEHTIHDNDSESWFSSFQMLNCEIWEKRKCWMKSEFETNHRKRNRYICLFWNEQLSSSTCHYSHWFARFACKTLTSRDANRK